MVPERAGDAITARLQRVMAQRMPTLAPLQPGRVGAPMVGGVVRDGVSQVARKQAEGQ